MHTGKPFHDAVMRHLDAQILAIHGKDVGEECMSAFAATVLTKNMLPMLLRDLNQEKFTAEDAAIGYFDAAISAIKAAIPAGSADPEVSALVARMEHGLDRMFTDNPGPLVPWNGKAGPMMAEWTKEA